MRNLQFTVHSQVISFKRLSGNFGPHRDNNNNTHRFTHHTIHSHDIHNSSELSDTAQFLLLRLAAAASMHKLTFSFDRFGRNC